MNAIEKAIARWGAAEVYHMSTKKHPTWWREFWRARQEKRSGWVAWRKARHAAMKLDAERNGNV